MKNTDKIQTWQYSDNTRGCDNFGQGDGHEAATMTPVISNCERCDEPTPDRFCDGCASEIYAAAKRNADAFARECYYDDPIGERLRSNY